jgi:hypothetical protein
VERFLLSVGESGEVVAEAAAVKSAATPRAGGRILENIRLFLVSLVSLSADCVGALVCSVYLDDVTG